MKFVIGKIYLQQYCGHWVIWKATEQRISGGTMLGTVLACGGRHPMVGQRWYGASHEDHREITEEELVLYRMQGDCK